MKKTENIHVRVTPNIKSVLSAQAEKRGFPTVSAYLLYLIKADADGRVEIKP